MPQVIVGAAIGAAASTAVAYAIGGTAAFASASLFGGAITGATAYFAASFAISAALGVVTSALAPKPSSLTTAEDLRGRTVMTRNSISSRKLAYGTVKTSGAIVFLETTGEDNKYLHLCVTLAGHEISEIEAVYFNEDIVRFGIDDNTEVQPNQQAEDVAEELINDIVSAFFHVNSTFGKTFAGLFTQLTDQMFDGSYYSKALITGHYGSADQAADSNLVSRTSATSDHRFRNIAYIYTRFEYDQDVYPNGMPNVSAVIKGKKVYDPRTSTTSWSDNAALCIRDYLTDSLYGIGATAAEIDEDSFIAAANICDEDVDVSSGNTEKRYTINGIVDTAKAPSEILNDMLVACQGSLYYSNGQWHIKAGAYSAPSVTLTDDDLRGSISIQTRNSGHDQFNAVKGVFVSPETNWQPTDFPEVTSTTFEAEDNNERKYVDMNMPFTTSYTMAQRIARMSLYRNREQIILKMPCKLSAFQFDIGDTVAVTNSRLGFSEKPFEVIQWTFSLDGEGMLGVDLILKETSSTIYQWDENTDEKIFTYNNTNLPKASDVTEPSITVSDELRTRNQEAISVLIVDVTSGGTFVSSFEVEAKKSTDTNWVSMGRASSNRFELLNVEDGAIYDVRARAVNTFAVRSTFATDSHQVVGKTAPPQDVTGFTGNVVNGALVLTWNPVTDLDLSHYRLRYASATSDVTYQNAVNLVQKIPRPSASAIVPARTGTYFIKAVDKLGLASETATTIVVDTNVTGVENLNVVQTINEHPSFAGVSDDTVSLDGEGFLILDTENQFDSKTGNFDDALGLFDGGSGDVDTEGFYYFDNSIDLSGVYTARVTASMTVERLDYVSLFDSAVGLFDSRTGNFDGDVNAFDDTDAELQVRHTQDDPSASPTWSSWKPFVVGDYTARGMEFRLRMTTTDTQATPKVTELSVTVDMPDRTEAQSDLSSGSSSYAVTFPSAFKATPAIGISATMQTGDYYEITSKSGSGFTITFKDSSGTAVDRTFDYVAKGYGRLEA